MLYQFIGILHDWYKLGFFNSLKTFNFAIELFIFILMCGFLVYAQEIILKIWKTDIDDENTVGTLHCIEIAVILILNLQLFRFLKIFKFFQSFIRQFLEITKMTA